jgi:hypothetical protein
VLGRSQPSSGALLPGTTIKPGAAYPKYRGFRLAVRRCKVETADCLLVADSVTGPPSAEAESAPVAAKPTDSMASNTTARSPADLRCMVNILLLFDLALTFSSTRVARSERRTPISNVSFTYEIVGGRRLFPLE